MKQPIKRHPALQPLSRDHHFGLLLCWKIREGFRLKTEAKRIKDYAKWFWQEHLQSHFKEEEEAFSPILGNEDPLMQQLYAEHNELKTLFSFPDENAENTLAEIEEKLKAHIRFEERILFQKIQSEATAEQLKKVEEHHENDFEDNWKDEFWIQNN